MSILRFRILIIFAIGTFLFLPYFLRDLDATTYSETAYTDLSIGNSHALAINFATMHLIGINLYEAGADVLMTAESFYRVEKAFPHVKRVWIPVAPVYLYRDVSKPRWRRYGWFGSTRLVDFIYENPEHWSFFRDYLKKIKNYFITAKPYEADGGIVVEGSLAYRQAVDPAQLPRLATRDALFHAQDASFSNTANATRLNDFLNYLNKKGITVILYTPPYTENYYNSPILKKYTDAYKKDLESITKKHPNVLYLDFHDLFKGKQLKYFYDADHINLQGAKAFSKVLIRKVKEKIPF